jgi:E3 ubiquitin-protein ligase RGLG
LIRSFYCAQVDFTKSNTWNGKVSNGGRCLHDHIHGAFNPCKAVCVARAFFRRDHVATPADQKAIDVMTRTLEAFDDDKLIPVFGFGDLSTTDRAVFSFKPDGSPCFGLAEVLSRYSEVSRKVQLSGPTSFAPLIRKAIEIVAATHQYHILIILTDGAVDDVTATAEAIVDASHYPISIIAIGIGDADFSSEWRCGDLC